MSKKLKLAFFVMLLICLGFFREWLFVSINHVLYNKYYGAEAEINPDMFTASSRFFGLFGYQTLYAAKWIITPLFMLFFWFIQKRFLWMLFLEKNTNLWLRVLYLSLFLLAGISFFIGWAIGYIHEGYRFSRIFIGLLESPVPCMILIPLTYFYKNYNPKT